MPYRFKARSVVPGDKALIQAAIAVVADYPAVANVWFGSGLFGNASLTPTKRASSIANCTPGNIKATVAIDNVTGTRIDCPVAQAQKTGAAYYGDPAGLVDGTYVTPAAADVKDGVPNGVAPGAGSYDPVTGNYTDPGKANVTVGNDYEFAGDTQVAEFDEAARNTDPGEANVRDLTPYKIQDVPLVGSMFDSGGRQARGRYHRA
jgi:hypothetical protein